MKRKWLSAAIGLISIILGGAVIGAAEEFHANYEESKVPEYTLPDPLHTLSGEAVTTPETWREVRRPEILELFRSYVYGHAPERPEDLHFEVLSEPAKALEGKAIRKEIRVFFSKDEAGPKMDILLYLPAGAEGPVPLFLGMNFYGNHTINADPGITLSQSWMRDNKEMHTENNRATEASRGGAGEPLAGRGHRRARLWPGDNLLWGRRPGF